MTLFLLPPSETKAVGGSGAPLQLDTLAFPELDSQRMVLLNEVIRCSNQPDAAKQFKLGPKQAELLVHNQQLMTATTMPAIHRYTGVLYDEISLQETNITAWNWASQHLMIHSALFGLLRATDGIPHYRYSPETRLGSIRNKQHWAETLGSILAAYEGPIVDLRSKSFVALGPIHQPVGDDPLQPDSRLTLEIHHRDTNGVVKPMNHFNKKAKGEITQLLLRHQPSIETVDDFYDWLTDHEFEVQKLEEDRWLIITR